MQKHSDENNQHCPGWFKLFTIKGALDEHLHQDHGWGTGKRSSTEQIGGGAAKRQKLEEYPNNFYDIEKVDEKKDRKV